jgi:hypothetical protein
MIGPRSAFFEPYYSTRRTAQLTAKLAQTDPKRVTNRCECAKLRSTDAERPSFAAFVWRVLYEMRKDFGERDKQVAYPQEIP